MAPLPPTKPPPTMPKAPAPKKLTAAQIAAATKSTKSAKRALPGTTTSSNKKGSTTKRRKGKKDEKSTTTTTTSTANIPVNVYDAVLGEAEDLMAAAMEAQALGRLKMASAYQLLLHARLVGLGKRFDRARTVDESPVKASPESKNGGSPNKDGTTTATPNGDEGDEAATSVQELAKLIPSNIELDSAMMEHLARAAMELHHQRTGRRIQSDIASPPPPPPLAAGKPPADTKPSAASAASPGPSAATGVAWTEEEVTKCQQAMKKGTSDPEAIAKAVGTRTSSQVKAYLRNTQERQKGAQALEQEWQQQQQDDTEKEDGGEDTPRKRGGRGRKPPTQAMNTVPNAKLDARTLLSGSKF